MSAIRRVLLLALVSISGIVLLAPLAARSAAPPPLPAPLAVPDPAPSGISSDRGMLSTRGGALPGDSEVSGEQLQAAPMPTPASAPMEATLHSIATPQPTARATPRPVAAAAPAPRRVVTYDGDTVWDALARCESGGNWAINTGNGYYGGLQFSLSTWRGYGGAEFAAYPHEAARAEQIIVAERLRAARGYAPWPSCRAKLGLP